MPPGKAAPARELNLSLNALDKDRFHRFSLAIRSALDKLPTPVKSRRPRGVLGFTACFDGGLMRRGRPESPNGGL